MTLTGLPSPFKQRMSQSNGNGVCGCLNFFFGCVEQSSVCLSDGKDRTIFRTKLHVAHNQMNESTKPRTLGTLQRALHTLNLNTVRIARRWFHTISCKEYIHARC